MKRIEACNEQSLRLIAQLREMNTKLAYYDEIS